MVPHTQQLAVPRTRRDILRLLYSHSIRIEKLKIQLLRNILRKRYTQREADGIYYEEEDEALGEEPLSPKPILPRRWYTRPWVEKRDDFGHYHQLLPDCRDHDPETYKYYVRVLPRMFDQLLGHISHRITKKTTNWKQPIDPGLKLAATLRFLATGEAYKSLSTAFRVGTNTISLFVPEVCEAIIQEFMRDWIVCPTHADGWKDVADGFKKKWNFHHTLGAIDGKHIRIFKPPKAGSLYYNYKSYFSIIIMAIVDADGRFIYVDVGAPGSCSDGGVFRQTPLRGYLEEGTAGLPADQPLPGDRRPCPYFFVADAAFPMKTWLQKPHPQRGLTEEEQVYNQIIYNKLSQIPS